MEGPRSVKDLLARQSSSTAYDDDGSNKGNNRLVQQVLIAQSQWFTLQPEIQALIDSSSPRPPHVVPVADAVFATLADTVTPQGILAVVQIPCGWKMLQQQHPSTRINRPPLYLVLDALGDPGNLGTLLRSAVAVGVQAVLLLPGTTDPWSPKALRSSMGCAFCLPLIACDEGWQQALEFLTTQPVPSLRCAPDRIHAATMLEENQENDNSQNNNPRATSTCYYNVDWAGTKSIPSNDPMSSSATTASALIIGNEGNGLSNVVRQAALQGIISTTYVPMLQASVESLNAGVCGSVIMFEYFRQCQLQERQQE